MNKKKVKIAFFDWDTTSADEQEFPEDRHGFPKEMEDGLVVLQDAGFTTTFNTTRDPIEFIDVLGKNWKEIIPQRMIVGLENGGRIGRFIEQDGEVTFEDVKTYPLDTNELDLILDILERNKDFIIKFYSGDFKRGQIAWLGEAANEKVQKEKFPLASEVLRSSISELRELLYSCKPVYITISGEIELPRKLNAFSSKEDHSINSSEIDKRTVIEFIAEEFDIDWEQSLAAGDSLPDLPMLEKHEFGTVIVVGNNDLVRDQETIVNVKNARELGNYLQRISKISQ